MTAEITWENSNLNEFPEIEIDGEVFPYAVQDSKIDIQDYGLNNIMTKKLSTGSSVTSEEVNQSGVKIGIPVYQSPNIRKYVQDRREDGAFTITFNYTKAGYIERISNATIENVPPGQAGDTVTMVVVGVRVDIQKS